MAKFELRQAELLPPLEKRQVENLIKFLRLNASALADLANYESCCASDDADALQGFVYDALELGYGLKDMAEYVKENFGDDEEDEDDDE